MTVQRAPTHRAATGQPEDEVVSSGESASQVRVENRSDSDLRLMVMQAECI